MFAAIVFESPGFGWLAVAAVLIGVAAVVFAYTTGLRWRRYPAVVRVGLLALRMGVIAVLVIALLQPAWVRQIRTTQRPVIAVILDDSRSMSQSVDNQTGGADEPGRMSPSRYEQAVDVLGDELLPALADTHRVELFDVAGVSLSPDDLPTVADASRSPLTGTLLNVARDFAGEPLAGIVLLSDGREVSQEPAAGDLDRLGVPVYAIDLTEGRSSGPSPPDLAIQAVSANSRALVGNTVQVAVDMTLQGEPGAINVPVSIFDGPDLLTSRIVARRPGESSLRAELEFIPRKPGQHVHLVQVGTLAREVELANNRQTFPLTVRAKPLVVLYVDGVLRWESKFLREALAHDPDISVVSSVRTARPGADRGSQGLLLPEQLANVDVVILGDVEASFFSRAELSALRTWVTEGGGGLLLTGGYLSFGPEGLARTPLRHILPVEFSAAANPQIEQPFNLKLTEPGQRSPIFHLTGDRVRDTAFFQSLPALAGCSRIAGVKPAAQVLAVNPRIGGPQGARGLPVMVHQQVGKGRAMVFAVDTTWHWRMVVGGFTGNSTFYQQFWGQMVRWLATGEQPSSPVLAVCTDRYRYKRGQKIELRVSLQASLHGPDSAETLPADVPQDSPHAWRVTALAMDEKGTRRQIRLAELDGLNYTGELAAQSSGRWDIVVRAEPLNGLAGARDDPRSGVQSQVVTVHVAGGDLERRDMRPDRAWLMQAAQTTGGRVLGSEKVRSWAETLPHEPIRILAVEKCSLWRNPLWAAVFFVILGGEWVLRRRYRLA